MTKEVHPINPQLIENLKLAKANLKIAEQNVIDAESAIYTAAQSNIPEKGTIHVTGCKIVTGFYEKWNQDTLIEIERTWARKSNLPFPFKQEWKADGKSISYIRDNAADAYAELVKALMLTPKKPSFVLEGEKE